MVSPTGRGTRLEGNQFQNGSLKVGSGPGTLEQQGEGSLAIQSPRRRPCSDSCQVPGPALGSPDPRSWGDSHDFRNLDAQGWWAQPQRGSKWTSGQFCFSQVLAASSHPQPQLRAPPTPSNPSYTWQPGEPGQVTLGGGPLNKT